MDAVPPRPLQQLSHQLAPDALTPPFGVDVDRVLDGEAIAGPRPEGSVAAEARDHVAHPSDDHRLTRLDARTQPPALMLHGDRPVAEDGRRVDDRIVVDRDDLLEV